MKALLFFLVAAAVPRTGAASAGDAPAPAAAAAEAPAAGGDRIAATLYGFSVPDEPDFLMLIAPADLGVLHLEGRYNYEGLHTGSAFVGLTLRGAHRVQVDATAMLGVVIGDVRGLVPATRLTLSWWRLDLFTEVEYVVDADDRAASFLYCWSELGLSPLHWLRLAIVGQRTRVIHNALDVQRGLALGVTVHDTVTLTAYELNLGWIAPTYIAAIGVEL